MAFVFALAFTSTSKNLDEWKNLLISYSNKLFDGLVRKIPTNQITIQEIPTETINQLLSEYCQLSLINETTASEDPENQSNGPPGCFNNFYPKGLAIPKIGQDLDPEFALYSCDEKALYAHYAIVVFLAGKRPSDQNRSAFTEKRAKALIDKFKIDAPGILNGSMKISNRGQEMTNQAWLELSAFRAICFQEFSTLCASRSSAKTGHCLDKRQPSALLPDAACLHHP